ncbi:MAG: hypothetical protein K6F76_08215 [Clostridiales bacterium]|nr:hypothetical protein [Clostridiales bacterium]
MTETSQTVVLRRLEASAGMVITDKETETMRATIVYLGVGDSQDNYKEIDEDTPLPEQEENDAQPLNEN